MMKASTHIFEKGVFIEDTATIVGPKEKAGPVGKYFDKHFDDDILGQSSYEKAEIKMHVSLIKYLMNKTKHDPKDVDLCISGDLLDEIMGTSLTML